MSRGTNGDQPPSDELLLDVEDLHVTFPSEDGKVMAVRGVSYQVRRNEVFGIVGESGSGKSVSQMALMGLLPKTALIEGRARYLGNDLIGVPDRQVRHHRGNDISMIFQDPMTSLNPVQRVIDHLTETIQTHEPKVSDLAARA